MEATPPARHLLTGLQHQESKTGEEALEEATPLEKASTKPSSTDVDAQPPVPGASSFQTKQDNGEGISPSDPEGPRTPLVERLKSASQTVTPKKQFMASGAFGHIESSEDSGCRSQESKSSRSTIIDRISGVTPDLSLVFREGDLQDYFTVFPGTSERIIKPSIKDYPFGEENTKLLTQWASENNYISHRKYVDNSSARATELNDLRDNLFQQLGVKDDTKDVHARTFFRQVIVQELENISYRLIHLPFPSVINVDGHSDGEATKHRRKVKCKDLSWKPSFRDYVLDQGWNGRFKDPRMKVDIFELPAALTQIGTSNKLDRHGWERVNEVVQAQLARFTNVGDADPAAFTSSTNTSGALSPSPPQSDQGSHPFRHTQQVRSGEHQGFAPTDASIEADTFSSSLDASDSKKRRREGDGVDNGDLPPAKYRKTTDESKVPSGTSGHEYPFGA